jgi:hypothetical protein
MQPWSAVLGDIPWPLLPVGNRPLIEYWFEECIRRGISDIRLVLGEGAEFVEQYAGDGEPWGVSVTYSFLKSGQDPDTFLRRNPEQWEGGLFYIRAPVFLHRLSVTESEAAFPGGVFLDRSADGTLNCLLSDSAEFIKAFIAHPQADHQGRELKKLNLAACRT